MQKKTLFNPRQTLVLAYLLAVVLWLVRCLAGSAVMLNYKMQGKMPQVTLAPAELTTESFAAYSSNEWWTAPDDDPNYRAYRQQYADLHLHVRREEIARETDRHPSTIGRELRRNADSEDGYRARTAQRRRDRRSKRVICRKARRALAASQSGQ